jgi:uncharacterized protein YukE
VADISWSEFRVDLAQLRAAIGSVGSESHELNGYMDQIAAEFSQVKDDWRAPEESSFEAVGQWFAEVQRDLHALLEETVRRMQTAYDNYEKAEVSNTKNVDPGGSHGSGGSGKTRRIVAEGEDRVRGSGGSGGSDGSGKTRRIVAEGEDRVLRPSLMIGSEPAAQEPAKMRIVDEAMPQTMPGG